LLRGFQFAHNPGDSDQVRLEKQVIFLVASSCTLAGVIWTLMYIWIFGWGLIASLPLAFVVFVGGSLIVSQLTKNHHIAVLIQILFIMYITAGIQWLVGSAWDSGLVLVWSFCGPIAALIFYSTRTSIFFFVLFLVNVVITALGDDYFAAHGPGTTPGVASFLFMMNMGAASATVFLFAGFFMTSSVRERDRAEGLLLNILPRAIAPRLKNGQKTIADQYESASVLFADMVGSTPLFSGMSAEETVSWLNEVFILFDRLIEKHGLEKIRTIGDNYMVAAGVPERRPDHAQALTALALEMIDALKTAPERNGKRMEFRFGIHSGPLVAGVIGETKFQYDLWGDTVNTAARMESHGEVGKVQISAATHELINGDFSCTPRGMLSIKGKGEMETFFVEAKKNASA
jgi:guanylate cyclase